MRIIKGLGAMAAALLACAVTTGCSSDGEPEATPRADIQLTPAQKAISQSNVKFAIDLLKASNSADKNVLVATFSASAVLSMLANSSGEATSSEIIDTLHLSASDINEYHKTVTSGLLKADNRTKLTFANAVWIDGSMKPSSDFKNACNGYYKANVDNADFRPMFDESSAYAAKDLSISIFKQKINIEVNEQGTKVVVVTGSSGRDGKVVDHCFTIDTPFVYVIREVSTGTILFIGKAQSLKSMQ